MLMNTDKVVFLPVRVLGVSGPETATFMQGPTVSVDKMDRNPEPVVEYSGCRDAPPQ